MHLKVKFTKRQLMKYLALFFCLTIVGTTYAQRQNGGRRGGGAAGGQSSATREMPKFESQKVAGLFEYSAKKVIKKLKLKKGDSLAIEVTSHIEAYNANINQIKTDNKDLFEGLDIVVNQNLETARNNRNRELMQETFRMVEEKLKPIRDEVKLHQDQLDASLKEILSEDENEKWLEFKKSELEKLRPRRSGNDARNRPDNINGRSGRRRG